MKIAFAGTKGYHHPGGIENVVKALAHEYSALGHDVIIFGRKKYSNEENPHPQIVLKNTFTVETKRLGQIMATFTSLIYCIFKKIDIIHIHSFVNVSLAWIPRLSGKKIVLTIHNFEWNYGKWNLIDKTILRSFLYLLKFLPHVLSSASWEEVDFLRKKLRREVFYIPHGIPVKIRQPESRLDGLGLKKDNYFLYVGRITYGKGIEYLVPAFNSVKSGKKLVIVGYQFHADDYQNRIVELANNNPDILFLGYLEQDVLDALYSNAYVVVHPSESESNSLVVLEALAFGNCLLASDIPNITYIAGENALYFTKKNTQELCNRIEQLVNEPSLVADMKKKAEIFSSKFPTWRNVSQQYISLYNKTLSR